jgi:hypothetical protein
MKTPLLALIVLAISLVTVEARAADLTGTWAGHITDPQGDKHEITLNLKVDGNKVTGTLTGGPPNGEQQPIVSGKLDGEQLSFTVTAQGPGGQSMALTYKGKVSGNRIQGAHESPMGSLPWEVTKK